MHIAALMISAVGGLAANPKGEGKGCALQHHCVIARLSSVLKGGLFTVVCIFCRECAVKFNDYFEFPRQLDMVPYTVQGLAKLEGWY